jgi:hypothetical protein
MTPRSARRGRCRYAPASTSSPRSAARSASGNAFLHHSLQPLEQAHLAPALRFGDPRVMTLAGALCAVLTGVVGFTHRSLRARVAALLATPYSASQMSYHLTRLRRKRLIQRLPGTNTYVLTADTPPAPPAPPQLPGDPGLLPAPRHVAAPGWSIRQPARLDQPPW